MTTDSDLISDRVVIYGRGLVMSSVCAPAAMTQEQVEDAVNGQEPTGISSRWQVNNTPFTGTTQTSPAPCDQQTDRRHWLLSC